MIPNYWWSKLTWKKGECNKETKTTWISFLMISTKKNIKLQLRLYKASHHYPIMGTFSTLLYILMSIHATQSIIDFILNNLGSIREIIWNRSEINRVELELELNDTQLTSLKILNLFTTLPFIVCLFTRIELFLCYFNKICNIIRIF